MPGMKPTMTAERNEYRRQWRRANPEKVRAQEKRWRARYPEKQREHMRRNYLKYRSKRLASARVRSARPDVRWANHLRPYGLTQETYTALLDAQDHVCAICAMPERSKKTTKLAVDHDHVTGKVRGLLCSGCNFALGHLREKPEIARRLISYLEVHDAGRP